MDSRTVVKGMLLIYLLTASSEEAELPLTVLLKVACFSVWNELVHLFSSPSAPSRVVSGFMFIFRDLWDHQKAEHWTFLYTTFAYFASNAHSLSFLISVLHLVLIAEAHLQKWEFCLAAQCAVHCSVTRRSNLCKIAQWCWKVVLTVESTGLVCVIMKGQMQSAKGSESLVEQKLLGVSRQCCCGDCTLDGPCWAVILMMGM